MGYLVTEKTDLPAEEPIEVYGLFHRRIVRINGFDMESILGAFEWLRDEVLATPARLNEVKVKWSVVEGSTPEDLIVDMIVEWTPERTG